MIVVKFLIGLLVLSACSFWLLLWLEYFYRKGLYKWSKM